MSGKRMSEEEICEALGVSEETLDAWVEEAESGSWWDDDNWSPAVYGQLDDETALRMLAEYGGFNDKSLGRKPGAAKSKAPVVSR